MLKLPPAFRGSDGHRARSGGAANGRAPLADTLGTLTATVARAAELPGRVRDARLLARKLVEMRDSARLALARAECEATTSTRLGRDFSAKRARNLADGLREELADAEAMIAEMEDVARRLRREQRVLRSRLAASAEAVAALPSGPERSRLGALLTKALLKLEVSCDLGLGGASEGASAALYTFTRGETKQTGQAR